jgi:hypothetical protein
MSFWRSTQHRSYSRETTSHESYNRNKLVQAWYTSGPSLPALALFIAVALAPNRLGDHDPYHYIANGEAAPNVAPVADVV